MTAAASKELEQPQRTVLSVASADEFDQAEFRRMAREALASADTADPDDAAAVLLDSLTDAQCRVALEATLPNYMRIMAAGDRGRVRHEAVKPGRVKQATPASRRSTPTTAQRVNSWYQRTLATRIMVGDQWKFLRECTAADLIAAAEVRFKTAAATKAEGERLQALAEHMQQTGAKTVAKVKAEVLQRVYGG